MKKVYVLLAEGFELIEALTPVDVLRRCGTDVKTVSISEDSFVTSAQKVTVKSDLLLNESNLHDGDMLILPGGYPGYENLGKDSNVGELVKFYAKEGKYIGAICGAPSVLACNGIGEGKMVTCHTSIKDTMSKYNYQDKDVVQDEKIITGVGAGHSLEFALKLAENLFSEEVLTKVKTGMELL